MPLSASNISEFHITRFLILRKYYRIRTNRRNSKRESTSHQIISVLRLQYLWPVAPSHSDGSGTWAVRSRCSTLIPQERVEHKQSFLLWPHHTACIQLSLEPNTLCSNGRFSQKSGENRICYHKYIATSLFNSLESWMHSFCLLSFR